MAYGIWAFGTLFFCCEIGQRGTNLFEEIDDKIAQIDWYLFPNDMKVTLLIIIMTAQQPVDIECFGSFSCKREVFKKVSKKKEDLN